MQNVCRIKVTAERVVVFTVGTNFLTAAVLPAALPSVTTRHSRQFAMIGAMTRFVYRNTVAKTGDQILGILNRHLRHPPGRVVLSEHDFRIGFSTRHRIGSLAVVVEEDLSALPQRAVNRVDALVLSVDRLEDPAVSAFYRLQLEGVARAAPTVRDPAVHRWGRVHSAGEAKIRSRSDTLSSETLEARQESGTFRWRWRAPHRRSRPGGG
jgi:hypothetical protein